MRRFDRRLETREKVTRSRELRRESTSAERTAWQILRRKGVLGLKFRRQHPLHGFIVDFYCPALRLVLEIDGDIHQRPAAAQYDVERETVLKQLGYRVTRLTNFQVSHENLCRMITEALQATGIGTKP